MDISGPFLVTEDGNKYIMVVSDYFSKWPEAYAIRNQEATTVATTLIDNWISRFGVPVELHSDQGRNFQFILFQRVTEVLGIRKTPVHPQSDEKVKGFNRTMEEHLSKVVAEHEKNWVRTSHGSEENFVCLVTSCSALRVKNQRRS